MAETETSTTVAGNAPSLRLLTLNVWGLKFVSAKRTERIRAIADYICQPAALRPESPASFTSSGHAEDVPLNTTTSRTDTTRQNGHGNHDSDAPPRSRWDIVCLQELWCSEDWEYVQARCKHSGSGLVHGRYFYSGALGSGLCILSRFPIVACSTWPYSMNGSPLHVIEGDFYVAKACGQATLDLSSLGEDIGKLTVLNTHFFAPGGDWGEEWKRSHRLAQAWELARLANVAAERGQNVIVCGDLNSQPTSLVMSLLLSHAKLSDSWAVANPPESLRAISDSPTAEEAVEVNGITCDSPLNTWSAGKRFGDDIIRQKGKRLDYILFRRAENYRKKERAALQAKDCSVAATEILPRTGVSMSDHFGVETVFTFKSFDTDDAEEDAPIPTRPTSREAITLALAAITLYSSRSAQSAKAQLTLFGLSLLAIPILSVASVWQPKPWLNWIFVLLGVGTGVGGATMLYTGFVGGRWERSAIKNVLADMSVELARLEASKKPRDR